MLLGSYRKSILLKNQCFAHSGRPTPQIIVRNQYEFVRQFSEFARNSFNDKNPFLCGAGRSRQSCSRLLSFSGIYLFRMEYYTYQLLFQEPSSSYLRSYQITEPALRRLYITDRTDRQVAIINVRNYYVSSQGGYILL